MKKWIIPVVLVALTACSGRSGWKVEGTIENASADKKVAVEGFNAGIWYVLDSVAPDANGSFKYQAETAAAYPDIYRLTYGGKSIYFPIDSAETVTFTANGEAFDNKYSIEGSVSAKMMRDADQLITRAVKDNGVDAAINDRNLKRMLTQFILNDESGVVSYYIINRTVEGRPLFDLTRAQDVSILGAVAQKFITLRPEDPRTDYLKNRFLQARALNNPQAGGVTIEAEEIGLLDIELYDEKGELRKLADQVSKSGMTVLSFTTYEMDNSIAYNAELNKAMEEFGKRGLTIYQVAFDGDEVNWHTVAGNLPWTTVRCAAAEAGKLLQTYNVGMLPMTYIIRGDGTLSERVVDPRELNEAIKRNLR